MISKEKIVKQMESLLQERQMALDTQRRAEGAIAVCRAWLADCAKQEEEAKEAASAALAAERQAGPVMAHE